MVANCNFSHVVAYMICRFSARFFEKFFAFCKGVAGISFKFNCRAAIVKVHLLFRNSGTPRAVPLNFLCLGNSNSSGSLSFPSFSAYYDGNYASEISAGEEHRFHRLSFRCPSSDIHRISFNIISLLFSNLSSAPWLIFHARTLRIFQYKIKNILDFFSQCNFYFKTISVQLQIININKY